MPAFTIEIESRTLGSREETPRSTLLELLEERISVSDLIRRTVEEQVRELLAKQRLDEQKAHPALERQYLTVQEIAGQAQQGAVRFPFTHTKQAPDVQVEVQKALQAFASGRYLIFVGKQQVKHLDEEITVEMGTKVIFLRLMPLVGG